MLSAVDLKWGRLFDDKGDPTARLGQVLRGIANYLVVEYSPRNSLVVTPEKLTAFYHEYKLDNETFPFQRMYKFSSQTPIIWPCQKSLIVDLTVLLIVSKPCTSISDVRITLSKDDQAVCLTSPLSLQLVSSIGWPVKSEHSLIKRSNGWTTSWLIFLSSPTVLLKMESLNDYRSSFQDIFFQQLDIVRRMISWSMLLLGGSSTPRRMRTISGGLHPRMFTSPRRRMIRQGGIDLMTTVIETPSIVEDPRTIISRHHYLVLSLPRTGLFSVLNQKTPCALPGTPQYLQVQVTEPEVLYRIAIATQPQQSKAVLVQLIATIYLLLAIETVIPAAAVVAIETESFGARRVGILSHPSKQFLGHCLAETVIVAQA
jgi:hypothetical protein